MIRLSVAYAQPYSSASCKVLPLLPFVGWRGVRKHMCNQCTWNQGPNLFLPDTGVTVWGQATNLPGFHAVPSQALKHQTQSLLLQDRPLPHQLAWSSWYICFHKVLCPRRYLGFLLKCHGRPWPALLQKEPPFIRYKSIGPSFTILDEEKSPSSLC